MMRSSTLADAPDAARIESWLRTLDGFEAVSVDAVTRLSDGMSNVTCKISLSGGPVGSAVLRLQPEHGIFEPYDVLREGRVLRCLAGTDIPVPPLLAEESNPAFFGTPSILIGWIDAPHMGDPTPDADIEAFFADLGAFTAAVAQIHALDWRAAGLDFLGVPTSPADGLAREIEIVAARMDAFGCADQPLLARALAEVRASAPIGGRLSLCHGDPNPFNYLLRDGAVVGIVDWEQARISDPRSDIGQLVALANLKGIPFGPAHEMPLVPLYEEHAGALDDLDLFRAFWLLQLGVVFHGWKTVDRIEPWYSWAQVSDLLTGALDHL